MSEWLARWGHSGLFNKTIEQDAGGEEGADQHALCVYMSVTFSMNRNVMLKLKWKVDTFPLISDISELATFNINPKE